MDVKALMSKEAPRRYPSAPARYLVINDGRPELVVVKKVTGAEVTMEYSDGVQHRLSPEHFFMLSPRDMSLEESC